MGKQETIYRQHQRKQIAELARLLRIAKEHENTEQAVKAEQEKILDENGNDVRDLCKACEANIGMEERERIIKEIEAYFSATNVDVPAAGKGLVNCIDVKDWQILKAGGKA